MILGIINKLRNDDKQSSPKNISEEFGLIKGKTIQKSNLFTQIKTLSERGYLERSGKADYSIASESMKSDLLKRKNELMEEASKIDEVCDSLDNYFLNATSNASEQSVDYLGHRDLFKVLATKLAYANECYVVSKFPSVSFTYPVSSAMGRGQYVDILRNRCFGTKNLKVTFITDMGIYHPFDLALRHYKGDAKAAYSECKVVIKQFESQIKNYDNLEVRHLDHPFGFDVLIPVIESINEFFMFIRDEKDGIRSGIHIKSTKTVTKAYDRFMRECQNAERVTPENVERLSKKLNSDLKQLYQEHINKSIIS